ncbi:response regulator transcription factor [Acetobacterium woodii]|uniref:Stage 0 sporulation protein A homolog n=1 Tax=Acetobacterium woodii (strain ATCC 29683 / DSM 1030 / JCM 2381 / KCTC 1655 / WB1) TaxID=931626 RepID=H6LJR5_ACEWD|nr:response regulator transcription factor [Acetobacterium woodii]AFA47466.1 two-component system sensor histidine kinase response regulator [Acetobacterium woodii DSM 1030]
MKTVLLIDDDLEVQQLIKTYLERESFGVYCTTRSTEGLEMIKAKKLDLVILDIFLPDGNGLEVCKEIRRTSKIPITLISAKGDESDKVLGLGLGADDFITKPFSINELVARVKAQIRRNEFIEDYTKENGKKSDSIVVGPLVINVESRSVFCRAEKIHLTAKEFDLLTFLAQNKDRVFSKDFLYESIWGYESSGDSRTVTVHIRKIREKIEKNPQEPKIIVNVWGIGYKFTVNGSL